MDTEQYGTVRSCLYNEETWRMFISFLIFSTVLDTNYRCCMLLGSNSKHVDL
jgi:hypothetical protein